MWRLQVVEAQLTERLGVTVVCEETDLFGVTEVERELVMEAFSAGHEAPFVIVGDTLACADSLDVDAIARALREVTATLL